MEKIKLACLKKIGYICAELEKIKMIDYDSSNIRNKEENRQADSNFIA